MACSRIQPLSSIVWVDTSSYLHKTIVCQKTFLGCSPAMCKAYGKLIPRHELKYRHDANRN